MPYLHIHDQKEVIYEDVCPVCADVDDILGILPVESARAAHLDG